MKYEYLIFNLIVISGPLFFGFLKPFYFIKYFKEAIFSILIVAIPFIIWDALVTNRHWFFSDDYTIGVRFFGLPFEELMFFVVVPYACLFTWEMVYRRTTEGLIKFYKLIYLISVLFISLSVLSFFYEKEYTSLALLSFGLAILFDLTIGAKIINQKRFYYFFGWITFFTLIFNGYLTWLPIVTYDEFYQIGFRIFTIPIEDFFFGFSLLILNTSIFEKLLIKRKLR